MLNTTLKEEDKKTQIRDDIHEITVNDIKKRPAKIEEEMIFRSVLQESMRIRTDRK